MPLFVRQATPSDFPAFLALQDRVYIHNLSPEARADGFISTLFSPGELEEIIAHNGLFLALEQDHLAGYVFALDWQICLRRAMFRQMAQGFPLDFRGHKVDASNSFQWGPVCVAPNFRGAGVLELLFDAVKVAQSARFPFGATFISARNGRSLSAHTRKLGLEIVSQWEFEGNEWKSLVFETRAPD